MLFLSSFLINKQHTRTSSKEARSKITRIGTFVM